MAENNKGYGSNAEIKPKDCYVDVFNRDLDKTFARKLTREFDPEQFGRPIVSLRKNKLGKYSIIDGQHRIEAHRTLLGENEKFPCIVREDMTFVEEAIAYMNYNNNRKNLHPNDRFRGDVYAEVEHAVQINNIFQKYNIVYGKNAKSQNHLTCIGTVRLWFKGYPGIVDDTLRILSSAWSDKKNAYTLYSCSSLYHLLKTCRNDAINLDEDKLIERIKKHDPLEIKNSLDSLKNSNFTKNAWVKDSNPFGAQIFLDWYNYNCLKKNQVSPNIFGNVNGTEN